MVPNEKNEWNLQKQDLRQHNYKQPMTLFCEGIYLFIYFKQTWMAASPIFENATKVNKTISDK